MKMLITLFVKHIIIKHLGTYNKHKKKCSLASPLTQYNVHIPNYFLSATPILSLLTYAFNFVNITAYH